MIIAGVEDAGRGPVIGPMVLAIAAIEEEKVSKLESIGAKDSKELTAKQREDLFSKIEKLCETDVVIIWPKEIDEALSSTSSNLNWLEADKMAELINRINPDKAVVDCPSNNIKAFKDYLRNKIERKDTALLVEHKADQNHVIVGAASIIAKVTRDREIEKLKKEYDIEFGSGYPSDPKTVEFLKKHWNDYPIFRKSWASWKKVANEKEQSHLGDF